MRSGRCRISESVGAASAPVRAPVAGDAPRLDDHSSSCAVADRSSGRWHERHRCRHETDECDNPHSALLVRIRSCVHASLSGQDAMLRLPGSRSKKLSRQTRCLAGMRPQNVIVARSPRTAASPIGFDGRPGSGIPPPGLKTYWKSGCNVHHGVIWAW